MKEGDEQNIGGNGCVGECEPPSHLKAWAMFMAHFATIAGVIVIGIQTCSIKQQTDSTQQQTEILASDMESTLRPWVSVSQDREKTDSVSQKIAWRLKNHGRIPACGLILNYSNRTGEHATSYQSAAAVKKMVDSELADLDPEYEPGCIFPGESQIRQMRTPILPGFFKQSEFLQFVAIEYRGRKEAAVNYVTAAIFRYQITKSLDGQIHFTGNCVRTWAE